ncbi:uncharacterized protein G2W53_020218 [Senna tora]|uniref:Uncharacterized protein n=1 Tax=Senna tora TaxID=362788 RepID=A0A834WSA2_9FABA|nr:uncharacterized protein G2W53_020218 [Senna tora]
MEDSGIGSGVEIGEGEVFGDDGKEPKSLEKERGLSLLVKAARVTAS